MGSAIVGDLAGDFDVAVFDKSKEALSRLDVKRKYRDNLLDRKQILDRSELIVTTLPGSVAYDFVRALLKKGKKVVDTSFMEEDPFTLDSLARRSHALYVPDAGYAPGTTNVLAGRLFKKENVDKLEIVTGGLPLSFSEPFHHAVTFNVEGLIDEYTRPARIVRNGSVVSVDPLTDITPLTFGSAGEFDAFYSDGLRTLLRTLKVSNMFEKTLRYPGHLQRMKLLRDLGYFSSEPVNGQVPKKVSEALFSSYRTDFRDICLTSVTGSNGKSYRYSGIDRYNSKSGVKSMARMTGYAATSMGRIVLEGLVEAEGVYPPEYFGFSDSEFTLYMRLLRKRGIKFSYEES